MYDLQELAGRYRVTVEESWQHDRTLNPEDKLWYKQIEGKYGIIFPVDEENIGVIIWSNHISMKVANFLKIENFKLWSKQDEDYFEFDTSFKLVKEISKMIKAKTRRVLSPEETERVREMGRKWRFEKKGALNLDDKIS